ncbi:MAG: ATP-grasp domain-containing protein [Candidatus Thiodiazotropha sp. (ex Myrtea sp. 'scaly one' KF741663)]|nr:ATP-grasp domain-containing protein [Candidatus Thiodiazotropha sp. (ex Myrtea sp. 'scaly one' KF741663)]
MKNVLLVGSSFSAAPLFFNLKKRGFKVSVVGNSKSDPCHQYSDESCYFDYSKESNLLDLVRDKKFDFIVPACNDYSYMSCVSVAEELGYPGFDNIDTAVKLHVKDSFRRLSEDGLFNAPKQINFEKDIKYTVQNCKFPLLVKPVDSFSGIGVVKVYQSEKLQAAIDQARLASRIGEVVIEEFIDGSLHSYSVFIRGNKIVSEFVVDEYCTVYPYQVNCSNCPSILQKSIIEKVRIKISSLIESLELVDGLLHTQFMTDGKDVWIVECMRRCPGDLYGELINRATGYNYTDMYLRPFINLPIESYKADKEVNYSGRHTISLLEETKYFSIKYKVPSKRIDFMPLKNSGEYVGKAPFDKIGILFIDYENQESMKAITPNLAECVTTKSYEVQECE